MSQLSKQSITLIILGAVIFAAQILAFSEPSSGPPLNNVAAPLNVSSSGQSKSGGVILNTGGAANGLIVQYGNVGIGTTNPGRKLEIYGTDASNSAGPHVYFRTTADSNPTMEIYNHQHGNIGILYDSYITDSGVITSSNTDGSFNLYVNGGKFKIGYGQAAAGTAFTFNYGLTMTNTGNVGIGTQNPQRQMELSLSGASQTPNLRLSNTQGNGYQSGIEWYNTYSGGAISGQLMADDATFYAKVNNGSGGLVEAFAWNRNGIRVGSSDPASKGDGTINVSGGYCINGNCITSWPSGGSGSQTLSISGQTLSISGGNNVTLPSASGIPSGAVMAFNLSSCPDGWSEFTQARGRYVVGLPSGGTLAGTAGTALSDLENRPAGAHTHNLTFPSVPVSHERGSQSYMTYDMADSGNSTYTTDNGGLVSGTNAPYIQLLYCQKN